MKILCMCQGGTTRSVAMAYVLKKKYKIDALAVSWRDNSRETIDMLCDWSDQIIVVDERSKRKISEKYLEKTLILDMGIDRWLCIPRQKDLINLCNDLWIGRGNK